MNRDRILLVANVIEEADRFNLMYFASDLTGSYPLDIINPAELAVDCNTTGCVAGWASTLMRREDFSFGEPDTTSTDDVRQWLDLTPDQAENLFFAYADSAWARKASHYSWKTHRKYDDEAPGITDWTEITAKQCAEVLRDVADDESLLDG